MSIVANSVSPPSQKRTSSDQYKRNFGGNLTDTIKKTQETEHTKLNIKTALKMNTKQ